jgi:lysophospholipase L1-like esterase
MVDTTRARDERSRLRRIGHLLLSIGVLLAVAVVSITLGLRVTPTQSVTALGQTVAVGTTTPSWSLRGPGQVDLFGQSLPTRVRFWGPIRPRLVLTDITINEQVASLFAPSTHAGSVTALGDRLAAAWKRYFGWEIVFVALFALLLLGVIAGWRRHAWTWKKTLVTIVGGLLVVEAINVGVIMLTAFSAPTILQSVHSLGALVGRTDPTPIRAAPGPPLVGVQALVLGDSTAAGIGTAPLRSATKADQACGRSSEAFAVHLAQVNDWTVRNLACGGATIRHGILGRQNVGGMTLPAQLAVAKRATSPTAVVISVGANDMMWGPMIRLCAVSVRCDDRASTAFFQSSLSTFARDYYELLRQLTELPGKPRIVINLYYAPFERSADCIPQLTPDKIATLLDRLDALNAVLSKGAQTFGFLVADPDFAGHGLCSASPYVQGLNDLAPFHPNARGELVIALADERTLLGAA